MLESPRPRNPLIIPATRRRLLGIAAALALTGPRAAGAQGTPAPAASPAALPDTPVGRQLAWVLETINAGAGDLSAATLGEHFSPEFLAAVPPDQLLAVLQALGKQAGTLRFVRFQSEPTATQAIALVTSETAGELNVSIVVNPEPPYLIEGLLFQPAATPQATPVTAATWEELDEQLGALAPVAEVTAAEIIDETPRTVHAFNSTTPIAIGSVFKLYVLGELARRISEGGLSWDDQLAIRDEWKSLPTGEMRNEPAGAQFTLRHYAEQMISVSDNTAADHLLFFLGRERVEDVQTAMRNAHAERNAPFLSTRELFALKLVAPDELVQRYIEATADERRRILEDEIAPMPVSLTDAVDWTAPRFIEEIEWFAAGEDLVRAMATLRAMSAQPGLDPLREILAINPGVEIDSSVWTYAGFKGGSEPGVFALSWLLQRADGRWFTLNLGINDPTTSFGAEEQMTAIALAEHALALLAATP